MESMFPRSLSLIPTIMLTKSRTAGNERAGWLLDPKACMQQVPNDEQKLVKDVLDKLD